MGGFKMSKKMVSASEVGKVAWCPHGASLIAQGVKPDARHEIRTKRGTASHQRLTQEVLASQDKRCFIASYAFGVNHPMTCILRSWRDRSLSASPAGRAFIALYYRISPPLITICQWIPGFKWLSRMAIRHFIQIAGIRGDAHD